MKQYFKNVGIGISILLNAVTGGNPYQTFCARSYENKKQGKFNLVNILDYFLGDGHCMNDWVYWQIHKVRIEERKNKK